MTSGGLSTYCYDYRGSQHERCAGCNCDCHNDGGGTFGLSVATTAILAVLLLVGFALWRMRT